ncbi:transcriptional regulator, partial [Terriglobus sp. YAF25]
MESAEVIVLYLFDDYELSEQDFSLSRRGERMSVEPKALRVLFLLVAAPGTLLEKKTILGTVWKDTFVEESTLTRAIAILRKQLGDDPKAPKYIETVPTLGYRFIAQVRTADPSSPASNEVREHDEPEAIAAEELPKAGGGESTLAMSHSARYAPRRIWIYGLAVGLC